MGEKKKRQKSLKLAASGGDVKEANVKKLKAKAAPLAAKIDALQQKFSKKKLLKMEKIRLWKLNKKGKGKGKGGDGASAVAEAIKNAPPTKEERNKKRNLKKKLRLGRRKAEGVAVFKPRKGRKGEKGKAEVAMVEYGDW